MIVITYWAKCSKPVFADSGKMKSTVAVMGAQTSAVPTLATGPIAL